jgi:NADPH:quinone reductase-like Zn-dependent oxidoreductase
MSGQPNQGVVADPAEPRRFVIRDLPMPSPLPSQAVVAVRAFSLNPGELRTATQAREPLRPGWDFAGVVVRAATDGSGPAAGTRVVGVSVQRGAWTRQFAVASNAIAEIPDTVSFEDACCLPIAGLTALFLLERAGALVGKTALITGPTGSVGWYAAQVARLGGARVTAVTRNPSAGERLAACGVEEVLVDADPFAGGRRFDVILEVIGGASLAEAMTHLNRFGRLLVCGNSSEGMTQFTPRDFYLQHGASMHGFHLLAELEYRPAADGLRVLATLVAEGTLRNWIGLTTSWTDIVSVAHAYLARQISGKAVLTIAE